MADKNFSSKGSFRKLQNELKKSFEETIKKASTEAFDDVEIEGEVDGKKVKVKGSAIKNEVQKQLAKNLEEVTISPTVNIEPEFKMAKGVDKKVENLMNDISSSATIKPEINVSQVDKGEKAITEAQKEIQKQIDKTNQKIKNQEEWLKHLSILDQDWTTGGKREAGDQLRSATNRVRRYRMNPEEFEYSQYAKEKIYIDWWRSYEEAQKKGVAQSVLNQNHTDIGQWQYDEAIEKLKKEQAFRSQVLEEGRAELEALENEYKKARNVVEQTSSAAIKSLTEGTQRLSGVITDFESKKESELKDTVLKWIAQDEEIYNLVKKMNDRTYELTSDTGMMGSVTSYGSRGSYVRLQGTRSSANFFVDENGNRIRKPRNLGEGITKSLGSTGKSFKGYDVEDYRKQYLELDQTVEKVTEDVNSLNQEISKPNTDSLVEVLELLNRMRAYLEEMESDEHADIYGFQDLKGGDFNRAFAVLKHFDFNLLKNIGFSDEEIAKAKNEFAGLVNQVNEVKKLGRQLKGSNAWDSYLSEHGQAPESRIMDLWDDWLNLIDKLNNKIQELGTTEKETFQEIPKYVQKSEDEIYESALKLAQNEEGIFEEIAQQEINLANKTSGETKKAYAEMATATYKMFKEDAYESEIEDKIRSTDVLIKELQGRIETETNPEVILSLNEQLDEAKIKILALQEVFKDIRPKGVFNTSDFEDRDVLEKYSRKHRENYTIGQSNYSIASEDREYWQTLTKGISSEKELTDAIVKRKEEMVALTMEMSKAEDQEHALMDARDALPYGKERDAATAAYDEAFDHTQTLTEKYNEIRQELYNLIQLQNNWGKSIQDASEINSVFMYSEWREEEQALYTISDEIEAIAKLRLQDAEAARQEADEVKNETETQEENTKAARKRLTERARYYLNKANEGKIDYSETEAQFNRIISEMQQLGESTAHVEEQFAKAKATFNMDGVAEESEKGAEKVEKEAESFSENAEKAQEAAQAKGKFNEANKETQQEADKSTDKVKEETEAVDEATLAFDGYYKNQHNKVGDDSWGYTERVGYAQDLIRNISHDDQGNLLVSESLRTNYEKLEKEVLKVDKAIINLKSAMADMSRQGIDTTESQENLNRLELYLSELEGELNKYYSSSEYMPSSNQQQIFANVRQEAAAFEESRLKQKEYVRQFRETESARKNLYGQMADKIKEIYSLREKNVSLDRNSSEDSAELVQNEEKINSLLQETVELREKINNKSAQQLSKDQEISDLARDMNKSLTNTVQRNLGSQIDDIESGITNYSKKINEVLDSPKFTDDFKQRFKDLDASLKLVVDDLKLIKAQGAGAFDAAEVEALKTAYDDLSVSIEKALQGKKLSENKSAALSSLAKLRKSIEDIEARNSAMGRSFREQFDNLKLEIDTAKSNERVEQLKAEIVNLEAELIRSGKIGKSAFQQFKEAISTKNTQFLAQYFSWQDWIRYIRELAQNVVGIDSALTELRKVSDASNERLQQSFKKSSETALELGQSIQHVVNVTADWSRLGYSVDDAEELARVTALFTTVGDNMSADDASSYLISTLQGFHVAAEDAEDVVDIYNEVANNFAIDTRGIGEALQRSAASFDAANTSLEKSVALITATNTVVQDPSSVGTLWKTLSARIRGAKTELSELGEEEDEFTQTTSKLQGLVKGLTGFDILKEDGKTFKDIYDIVLGIGKEWNNLTDIEQASLGEALAGKRNANALYAVLNNIETLEDAYDAASHAEESAAREQENYAKSVQYSLDRFRASIERISVDLLDSKLVKSIVEGGISILDILDQIISRLDSLPTLLTTAASAFTLFKTGGIGIDLNDKNWLSLFGNKVGTSLSRADVSAINAFTDAFKKSGVASQAWRKTMSGASEKARAFVHDAVLAGQSADEIAASMEKATGVGKSFSTVMKKVGSSLLSFGANAAIVLALSAIVKAITTCINAEEELAERTRQLSEEYGAAKADIDSYKSEISDLYIVLRDQNSSYEDSKTARERLLAIQDELINKYGVERGAVEDITAAIDGEIDALDRLSQSKWQETLNAMNDSGHGFWDKLEYWFNTDAQGYNSQVQRALHEINDVRSSALGASIDATPEDVELLQEIVAAYEDINLVVQEGPYGETSLQLYGSDMQLFYQALLDVQNQVNQFGGSDNLNKFLETTANNAKDVIDEFGSFGDLYIQNEKIAKSFEYSQAVDDVTSAVKEYQKAYAEGFRDEDERNDAIEQLSNVYTESLENIDDEQVKGYIERLYPEIKSVIDNWRFDLNFNANVNDTRDKINNALELFKDANGDYLSYEELKVFNPKLYDKGDDRVKAYKALQVAADEYGISIDVLIEKLKEENLLLTDDYQQLVAKYGKDNIDKLLPEDLEIALTFSYTNFGTFDALVDRIKAAKEELETPIDIELNPKMFSEQVNKLDDLQKLYDSFYEKVTEKKAKINLDIKDVEELRETFGAIEGFDFNNFERIVSSDTSTQKEIQDAFDAALTAYANQKIALEGINEENKDMIRTQLELEGATHKTAQAFVDEQLAYHKIADDAEHQASWGIEDVFDDAIADSQEYCDNLKEIYKQYGNIDNVNRNALIWDDETLKKYEKFAKEQGIDESRKGYWSTVIGTDDTFQGVRIAYTQLFDNGKELVPFTADEVRTYINDIVTAATDGSGKVDADKILELDASPTDIDGNVKKFYGMIAAAEGQHMGDIQITADDVMAIANPAEYLDKANNSIFKGMSMHDVQAESLNAKRVEQIKAQTSALKMAEQGMNDYTAALDDEAEKLGVSIEELAKYRAEMLMSEGRLDTTADQAELIALSETLKDVEGEVGDYYSSLNEALRYVSENSNLDLTTATASQITALQKLGEVSEGTAQQLYYLAYQAQSTNVNDLTTTASVSSLLNLANAANITGPALDALLQLLNQFSLADEYVAKGMDATARNIRTQAINSYKNAVAGLESESSKLTFGPSEKEAKSAGGKAADAYVEEYEKEKKALERDRDMGLISEKQYLDKLKELIDKFFKDRAEYAENYMDEMKDYMNSVMSYYNSVISGVTTLLDHRISSIQDTKDSTISALEEEKEAAEEAYQAQIDAIQEEIDALDDLIDKKNEEIDALNDQIQAIEDANAARDRSIQLQKAEYELQRAQNQRTKLVYTGEIGTMRYETDTSAIRDQQEAVKDAQDEIAIAAIEKQIKLIEDEIEAIEKQKKALEDQQEELQKAMESTSKYYEKMIKEQEKMFDDMIKKLEETKKKWEELAAIEELSKSWGLVSEAMAEYGYTVEDVLNDTPGAFEAFKNEYLRILQEMHSGDKGFLEGVKQFGGEVPGEFQKVASSATEAEAPIKKLGDSAGTATGKVSSFGTAAGTAATGVGQLKDKSEGIADNLNELNGVQLSGVIDGPLTTLEEKLTTLKDLISGPDSLLTAFNNLNTTVDIQGIVDSFTSLDEAIQAAVASIGGGGTDEEGTYGGAGKHGKNGMPSNIPASGVDGGTGGGLVGAINSVKDATDAAIGTSAEEEGETATGAFFALKTAVDNVTSAIGMGEEGGDGGIKGMLQNAGSEGGGGEGTLTAAITSIKPTTETALKGEGGAIAAFEEFKEVLAELVSLANGLLTILQKLSSIKLPQIHGGSHGFWFTGSANPYQHYEGTAKLNGDWGVKKGGRSLVGELGQELMVTPDGRFKTIGDRGPEFINVPKGSVIFNHLQTKELLDKKNLVLPKKGRSFANGTLPEGFFPWSDSSALNSLKAKIAEVGLPTIDGIKSALQAQTDAIRSEVRNAVSNNSSAETTVNQHNTFNISGVSGEDVARQINTTLVNTFSGMSLNAYQRSMA